MPYEVRQLLTNLNNVITAAPDESIQTALGRMLQHDYSQLPVVKGIGQDQQFFLITCGSILTALNNFGATTTAGGLRVRDALVRVPHVYFADDDLFELLQGMRDTGAALILDEGRRLTHIVTSYDTTLFFRQWAEDMMRARDIEESLKQYINAAFKTSDGEIDEIARQSAIDDITSSNKALRKKFDIALDHYLHQRAASSVVPHAGWSDEAFLLLLNGQVNDFADEHSSSAAAIPETATAPSDALSQGFAVKDSNLLAASIELKKRFEAAISLYLRRQMQAESQMERDLAEDAFTRLLDPREKKKEFRQLTLDSFVTLFFHERCWPRCSPILQLEQNAVRHMFEGVRDTRNKLAHFREDEITAPQRTQLYSCAEWLGNHSKTVTSALEASSPAIEVGEELPSALGDKLTTVTEEAPSGDGD